MRIHEIIKERRKAQGMTQEQAALRLGISASAFNKWERGTTYPDITILPALARLLEVDLNTLLSFQEELTDKEIALWTNQITDRMLNNGFLAGYEKAVEKIKEYPNSGSLLYTFAATLESGLYFFGEGLPEEEKERFLEELESFYVRAAGSKEEWVRTQANTMLASKLMNRGEFVEAEERIRLLPESSMTDKRQLLARLYYRTGRYEEAAKLIENKILSASGEIFSSLLLLLEIAVKEGRFQDAEYLSEKACSTVQLYEMWEYSSYISEFQLAVALKDKERCIRVLGKMLPALEKEWRPGDYCLYNHIGDKESKERRQSFRQQMKRQIVKALQDDGEMGFLKEEKAFQSLLKRYSGMNHKLSDIT